MQPPITTGTVLKNRYKIIKILGQGGFGRTYLAEDQRRFNELCAIKELIPAGMGTSAWEKAQELFAREAAILYQIQHPQVPQFRERFEHDQRLFLIQDYIEGKTYYDLAEERKAVGSNFTEAEVLRLMRSLLPVLDYIHGKGIIHRDISPDNIIMRESDELPVLIDFGVVKELVSSLQSNNTTPQTYVGKPGYSPSEQIQTGQAYPSSDLYALAVCVIVLLTGKEPAELFDDHLLTWNWQRWVRVNPRFAQIVNRMLSYKPGGRYQNAMEVSEAIETLNQPMSNTPDVSKMRTVAVGRKPPSVQPLPRRQPKPVPPPRDPIIDNPLAIGAIGASVVVLAGLGSWALVRKITSPSSVNIPQSPAPQTFASPLISAKPTPTKEEPIFFSKRLNFGSSNTDTVTGKLKANQTIGYTFRGREGQILTVELVEENGVSLTVLSPNKELIDNAARQVSFYEGKLPFTGRYTIELNNLPEITEAEYTLQVTLEQPVTTTPKPAPTPEIEPTPTPEIEPTPTPEIEPTEPPVEETPTPLPIESTPTPEPEKPQIPPVDIIVPTIQPTPSELEQNDPVVEPSPESESESTDSE